MRKFTNPKAMELFNEAEAIEKYVNFLLAEGNSNLPDCYAERMTEAAGLRVLADEIEGGIISEELEDA